MSVHLNERGFLAQPVVVAVVRVDVDGPFEKERLIQTVQLFANRFLLPFDLSDALAPRDEQKGLVVEMRFFGGLTVEETAEVLGVSRVTMVRDWQFSKDWLNRELSRDTPRNP